MAEVARALAQFSVDPKFAQDGVRSHPATLYMLPPT
jgi:hypothetical protein